MIKDFNDNSKQWGWRKMTPTEIKNGKLTPIGNFMLSCHACGYWRAGSAVEYQTRILHPFGFIEKLIEALIIPIIALTSDISIQDGYKEWFDNIVLWKFKTPNI